MCGVNMFYNILFFIIGYVGLIIIMIWGWVLLVGNDVMVDEFVVGYVIFGVGMIVVCVLMVVVLFGYFLFIFKNVVGSKSDGILV